jgi:hypothetical protein
MTHDQQQHRPCDGPHEWEVYQQPHCRCIHQGGLPCAALVARQLAAELDAFVAYIDNDPGRTMAVGQLVPPGHSARKALAEYRSRQGEP